MRTGWNLRKNCKGNLKDQEKNRGKLGKELDKQIKAYITSFRESRSADSNMLAYNGGH